MSSKGKRQLSLDDIKPPQDAELTEEVDNKARRFAEQLAELEERAASLDPLTLRRDTLETLKNIINDFARGSVGDTAARRIYIWIIPTIVILWLFFTAWMLYQKSNSEEFLLSDDLIKSMMTATGVGLVGLFTTVVTYLFTKSKEQIELYKLIINKLVPDDPRDESKPG